MSTEYFRVKTDISLGRLLVLAARDDGDSYVMHTSYAGVEVGTRVTEKEVLAPTDLLVSEYGDITTVAAVRASAGAGRRAD